VLGEHRLDARRRRAAVEPRDDTLADNERERRNLVDAEPLGDLGARVDVDLADRQPVALAPCDVREEALHPPGRARALGREEDETGMIGSHHSLQR